MVNPFEKQLEDAIDAYEETMRQCRYDDGSDMSSERLLELKSKCLAAIVRASGKESIYYEQTISPMSMSQMHDFDHLSCIVGICRSLLSDIRSGYLQSFEEIIHANIFSDYLEMAEHLNSSGYKDAAAVIAGSTLEAHLKSLAVKFSVPTMVGANPVKADKINADLVKANAYTKLDQKSVTSWLDLRNNAAHGKYGEYDKSQVKVMILAVRDFVGRNPA